MRMIRPITRWFNMKMLRKRVDMKWTALNKRLNKDQDMAVRIVKKMSQNQDTDILIAPISHEIFLVHKDMDIIVSRNLISIINGIYHYDIDIPDEMTKYVVSYLYRVIERRRMQLKLKITAKVERSLEDILHQVVVNDSLNSRKK